MNNQLLLLQALHTLSVLIELVFDMGQYTRKYVLPAVIYVGVGVYHYTQIALDKMTSMEYNITVYRTPLTTGLAY